MNRFLIVSIIILAGFAGFLFFQDSVALAPELIENPHLPEDLLWPDDWISCVSPNLLTGEPVSSNEPPIKINRNPLAPGDCTIWSLAYFNWKRNPAWDLRKWYDEIEACGLKGNFWGAFYRPKGDHGGSPGSLMAFCKEPLSKLAGMPEQFSTTFMGLRPRRGRMGYTSNFITCPPFVEGQMLVLQLSNGIEGHLMTCELVSCPADEDLPRTFNCMERHNWNPGWIEGFAHELTVDSDGEVTSERDMRQPFMTQPFMAGWQIRAVHAVTP